MQPAQPVAVAGAVLATEAVPLQVCAVPRLLEGMAEV